MKVVLDTNVLVSGLISGSGPCGQIVGLLVEGILQPYLDERMLHEYEAVLARPELKIDPQDASDLLESIREAGEVLTPTPLAAKLPDAQDAPFLEVAATAQAVLITGNLRHFPISARGGVAVMSPREFIDSLGG